MDTSFGDDAAKDICQICQKDLKRYCCPRCNILYCSVQCYKSQQHLKCSEDFYRSCIASEVESESQNSEESMRKMYEILKRMKDADAGGIPDFEDDPIEQELDSDDDLPPDINEGAASLSDDEDLEERMKGIDLDDTDEVWSRLTDSEKKEFEKMMESGDIVKLLPDYTPWWVVQKNNSKIVDLSSKQTAESNGKEKPPIIPNIPCFKTLCKKQPSPSLHYNLWNIAAAYSCVVRFYVGEQQKNPLDAVLNIVNLSLTFKFGTNFEDADDALTSVVMESLTNRNTQNSIPGTTILVDSQEALTSDARMLMSCKSNKLSALCDILELMKKAKNEMKLPENLDLVKLFALRTGSVEIDRKQINHLIKKIEFLLAYVNSESDLR